MNDNLNTTEKTQESHAIVQPMSLGISLLFFGVPALVLFVGFHVIMPALIKDGFTPFNAYFVGLGIPLALLVIASLVAYRKEGNVMEWDAFTKRFRLHRLSLKMWLLTLGAFISILIIYGISMQINVMLLDTGIIPMPASLPAWLDTRGGMPSMTAMDQAFGGLAGNWLALFSYFVFLCFNVIGEEFWWRGYILPRQELAFGKLVWIIHGLLWAFFHAFKWWDILGILPLTLILPFLVWKFKNNTIGIVLHFLINGIGLIAILFGILGVDIK
jgi:membrane protease YdiL (CAAX protease family)